MRPILAINIALLTEGGCRGRFAAINMALLTEGAGTEWPKLQTSMNRGVNENAALKPDTIPADNHNAPTTVRRPERAARANGVPQRRAPLLRCRRMIVDLRERLARVRERIASAAERAGRDPSDITLITVSKTFEPAIVQQAVDAGALDLGENRVQEAAAKAFLIHGSIKWHLIGHLQSNKAKLAVTTFDVIHTVDSVALAEKLDRLAAEGSRNPSVLVQVDLGGEAAKSGALEAEVPQIVAALDRCKNLRFRGLMTLPPFFDSPEDARPYFRSLRRILDEINLDRPESAKLSDLSMGMSNDFEIAIEEGATMVRVGTAIFGSRSAGDAV